MAPTNPLEWRRGTTPATPLSGADKALGHAVHLLCSVMLPNPADPILREEFGNRLCVLQVRAIDDSHLHHLVVSERLAVTVQGGAAVSAEVRDDLVAALRSLLVLLWRPAGHLEGVAWNHDVGAVCRSRDLLAIATMAKGLYRQYQTSFLAVSMGTLKRYLHFWLAIELDANFTAQAASFWHLCLLFVWERAFTAVDGKSVRRISLLRTREWRPYIARLPASHPIYPSSSLRIPSKGIEVPRPLKAPSASTFRLPPRPNGCADRDAAPTSRGCCSRHAGHLDQQDSRNAKAPDVVQFGRITSSRRCSGLLEDICHCCVVAEVHVVGNALAAPMGPPSATAGDCFGLGRCRRGVFAFQRAPSSI